MGSSILIIVVGASVSTQGFDVIEDRTYPRLHPGYPLILPIYLSSPAFNFVAMSSHDHFCFLVRIRSSAFPVLPLAEGPLRDPLAETYYFYAQNLPTIVMLLPRAGLSVALLLSSFSFENRPGRSSLSDVDQSIACHDGTFFDKNTGALSVTANSARAAWRILVLLLSRCVAFLCFL